MTGVEISGILAAAAWGLRHGFDPDHLAALSDAAFGADTRRRALRWSMAYIAGHAVVLFGLGLLAVQFGSFLPDGIDAAAGRVIGLTLIAMAVYVTVSVVRGRRPVALGSRALIVRALTRLARRIRPGREEVVIRHDHDHRHDRGHGHVHPDGERAPEAIEPSPVTVGHRHVHEHRALVPIDPAATSVAPWFGIGALHGVGVESPTQLLVLAAAAGTSAVAGLATVTAFVAGLAAANVLLAVSLGGAAGRLASSARAQRVLAALVAAGSLAWGVVLLSS